MKKMPNHNVAQKFWIFAREKIWKYKEFEKNQEIQLQKIGWLGHSKNKVKLRLNWTKSLKNTVNLP